MRGIGLTVMKIKKKHYPPHLIIMRFIFHNPHRLALCAVAIMVGLSGCDNRATELPGGSATVGSDFEVIDVTPQIVTQLRRLNATPRTAQQVMTADEAPVYRIGAGDEVAVRLWVPKLEGRAGSSEWIENPPLVVRNDGMITLPVVGDISIEGKTLAQARSAIDDAMRAYYKTWQVRIDVTRYASQKAYVLGAVKEPGAVTLTANPLTVLEAIEQAGGADDAANLQAVELLRQDGHKEILNISAAMQGESDSATHYWLRHGDRLTLTTTHGNRAFVMGEVKNPKLVTLRRGNTSVMEMLTDAGGIDPKKGSYSNVYVIRGMIDGAIMGADAPGPEAAAALAHATPDPSGTRIYKLDLTNAIGLNLAAQMPVNAMDVVYVSPTEISRWNDFVNSILPISSTLLLNTLVNN